MRRCTGRSRNRCSSPTKRATNIKQRSNKCAFSLLALALIGQAVERNWRLKARWLLLLQDFSGRGNPAVRAGRLDLRFMLAETPGRRISKTSMAVVNCAGVLQDNNPGCDIIACTHRRPMHSSKRARRHASARQSFTSPLFGVERETPNTLSATKRQGEAALRRQRFSGLSSALRSSLAVGPMAACAFSAAFSLARCSAHGGRLANCKSSTLGSRVDDRVLPGPTAPKRRCTRHRRPSPADIR